MRNNQDKTYRYTGKIHITTDEDGQKILTAMGGTFEEIEERNVYEECVDEIMKIIEIRYNTNNVVPKYEIRDAIIKHFPPPQ